MVIEASRLGTRRTMGQHGAVTEDKRPVEQAVEALVYAPLGFALEARRLLPTFVERGRAQVQMARMIGQFAVKQGQVEADKHLGVVRNRAEAFLVGQLGADDAGRADDQLGTQAAATPVTDPPAPAAEAAPQAGVDAAGLAIAGYDSLAASQVIPRLAGLEADELEAVRRYESAHRGRKTILGKIDQLQEL